MYTMFVHTASPRESGDVLTTPESRRPHLIRVRMARPSPAGTLRGVCDFDMVQPRNRDSLDVRGPDGL